MNLAEYDPKLLQQQGPTEQSVNQPSLGKYEYAAGRHGITEPPRNGTRLSVQGARRLIDPQQD
jgi:hypothetical protein